MRHMLFVLLLVAVVGCGNSDTSPDEQATNSQSQTQAGDPIVNSIGMSFVPIPAGTFTMRVGDKAHQVTLTKGFEIGVYEVTQEQY